MNYRGLITSILLTSMLTAGENDNTDEFIANILPSLNVTRINVPIVIDGDISDAGWVNAALATNFAEHYPTPLSKPPINMETMVAYDSDNLYIAFVVYDDPAKIRASLSDRDAMWNDDYVGILLDTYSDANWAYFFFANPLGIQGDERFVNGTGEDAGINYIYSSVGQITETGYQVEMAIPFSSLRFPDSEEQSWKATFWVTHPRGSRSQYSWAGVDPDNGCWPCQWGTLTGISGIKSQNKLELIPSITGSQNSGLLDEDNATSGINTDPLAGDAGLTIKFPISNNIVADLAINPDFSQVEADAAQIDANETFALFFSERRPFFQEGGDIFSTYRRIVYTRSINNPSVVGKLTSRFGNTSMAYMVGRDENTPIILPFEERSATLQTNIKSTSNIFRLKQSFGESIMAGALITDRRLDGGGSGTVFSTDGRYQFMSNYQFEWQLMVSHTQEADDSLLTVDEELEDLRFGGSQDLSAGLDGESFLGNGTYLSLARSGKHYNMEFDYVQKSPTFRADNGFITSNNIQHLGMWNQYKTYFEDNKVFTGININAYILKEYNFDGTQKRQFGEIWLQLNMKAQTNVWVGGDLVNDSRFAEHEFKKFLTSFIEFSSAPSEIIRFHGRYSPGDHLSRNRSNPLVGQGYNASLSGALKLGRQLSFEPSWNYSELNYPEKAVDFPEWFDSEDGTPEELENSQIFSQTVTRTQVNYQHTREMFLRVIFQYTGPHNDLTIDPLFTYKINPFSAVYIGSSQYFADFAEKGKPVDLSLSNRVYFFKVQYLFNM